MNKIHYSWPTLHIHLSMDNDDRIFQYSDCIENNVCFVEFLIVYIRNINFKDHNFLTKTKKNLLMTLSFMNSIF